MDSSFSSTLAKKHVSTVLLFLLEKGTVKKTDIVSVVHSNTTVDKLTTELSSEGFIEIKKEFAGRKTYEISLTPKGRSVAEQLKRAEEAAKGKKFIFPDKFAVITFLDKQGSSTLNELKEEFHEAAEIVRELESLKVIRQEIDSSKHPPVNRIVLTEKGEMAARKLRELEEILKG